MEKRPRQDTKQIMFTTPRGKLKEVFRLQKYNLSKHSKVIPDTSFIAL